MRGNTILIGSYLNGSLLRRTSILKDKAILILILQTMSPAQSGQGKPGETSSDCAFLKSLLDELSVYILSLINGGIQVLELLLWKNTWNPQSTPAHFITLLMPILLQIKIQFSQEKTTNKTSPQLPRVQADFARQSLRVRGFPELVRIPLRCLPSPALGIPRPLSMQEQKTMTCAQKTPAISEGNILPRSP